MRYFPKVYIILLNYNGWADTIECLESLLRIDYPNYQIIVVDNNSPNNSLEYIKLWAEGKLDVWVNPKHPLRKLSFPPSEKPIPYIFFDKKNKKKQRYNLERQTSGKFRNNTPLIFIQTGENLGFAGGNNVAIEFALEQNDFEYICLLNNDTVVEKNFLSKIIEKMGKNKNIGICSCRINYYDFPKKIWFDGGYFNKFLARGIHYNEDKIESEVKNIKEDITFLTGCLMVIRKDVLKEIRLNNDYFMYMEDLEFSLKAIEKGYKLSIEKEAKIYHKVGVSSGGKTSKFSAYWGMRNWVIFIKTNLKLKQRIIPFSIIFLSLFKQLITGNFPKLKAQLKGLASGLKYRKMKNHT